MPADKVKSNVACFEPLPSASQFIDDRAEDRTRDDQSEAEDLDSEHSSDKAFINDASDLSVYSNDDRRMNIDDDSDLSSLSQDEDQDNRPPPDATTHSDNEVIIVDTSPAKRRRKSRKGKHVVNDINSADDMFTKRGSVKARAKAAPAVGQETQAPESDNVEPNVDERKVFLRLRKSVKAEEHKEEDTRRDPSDATNAKSVGGPAVQPAPASLPSPSSSQNSSSSNMQTEMEKMLTSMLDSRLEGITNTLLSHLTPILQKVAVPPPAVAVEPHANEELKEEMDIEYIGEPEHQLVTSSLPTADSDISENRLGSSCRAMPTAASVLSNTTLLPLQYLPEPITPPRKLARPSVGPFEGPRSMMTSFPVNVVTSSPSMASSPATHTFGQSVNHLSMGPTPAVGPLQSGFLSTPNLQHSPATPLPSSADKGKASTAPSVPVVASPSVGGSPARDNLARMFAANRIEAGKRSAYVCVQTFCIVLTQLSTNGDGQTDTSPTKRVKYHDDLITYPILFTPPAECGVSDVKLQDDAIKDVYAALCNLPGGRRLMPSFVRSQSGEDYNPGGRLMFSYWFRTLAEVSGITLYNAMNFKSRGRFFAPQRESPDHVMLAQEPGTASSAYKLYIGSEYAIGVTPGLCFESYLVDTFRSNANPPRYRKFISLLFHNQDWERFVSFMCCCFDRRMLHTQMTGKALQFSTKMNTVDAVKQTSVLDRLNKYTDDPKSGGPSSKRTSSKKFSLDYTDDIPVYDARQQDFDFNSSLPSLETALPLWPHKEIPEGSFVVVGYTVAIYKGTASGFTEKTLHLGCNLQWVIVCGTPAPKETDE
ncbi:hypothetical protein R3P38DRAFT_2812267 [Favolaschia claudopus]|uniref:Histone acetyltransferase n=1 Tax=Favolaschia claudopus TaxID=2862362 RepID=A0AAV9Z6U3_9AGAR